MQLRAASLQFWNLNDAAQSLNRAAKSCDDAALSRDDAPLSCKFEVLELQ
jgi:hypothetical protein